MCAFVCSSVLPRYVSFLLVYYCCWNKCQSINQSTVKNSNIETTKYLNGPQSSWSSMLHRLWIYMRDIPFDTIIWRWLPLYAQPKFNKFMLLIHLISNKTTTTKNCSINKWNGLSEKRNRTTTSTAKRKKSWMKTLESFLGQVERTAIRWLPGWKQHSLIVVIVGLVAIVAPWFGRLFPGRAMSRPSGCVYFKYIYM